MYTQTRFLLIKLYQNFSDLETDDIFKNILGKNIEIKRDDDFYVIYHSILDEEVLRENIVSLESELLCNVEVLSSKVFRSYDELQVNINLLKDLLLKSISHGYIEQKELIFEIVKNGYGNKTLCDFVLGVYKNDLEMYHIIDVFLKSDLNTSKASINLYMHRNTLINKLDRFYRLTGYDLRRFSDSFVIYTLIQKKH